jgi:flagellar biosynthesis/type III secretory pathway ATPase
VRDLLITDAHRHAANLLLQLEAAWREKEDLILVGAYQKGSDPLVDAAIGLRDALLSFLRQPPSESTGMDDSIARLRQLQMRYEHLMGQRVTAV